MDWKLESTVQSRPKVYLFCHLFTIAVLFSRYWKYSTSQSPFLLIQWYRFPVNKKERRVPYLYTRHSCSRWLWDLKDSHRTVPEDKHKCNSNYREQEAPLVRFRRHYTSDGAVKQEVELRISAASGLEKRDIYLSQTWFFLLLFLGAHDTLC